MTIITAITGGIGSGKSTFSKEVLKRGFKLLDSDSQVAKFYENPKKDFLNYLKKIGLGVCIKQGRVDKKNIAKIIFSDDVVKTKLEKYIFRLIRKERVSFINKQKKNKKKIIFFDIPLLFENNLMKDFDIIISIISTKKNRYKRLKKSKQMTKNLFNNIVKSQTTDLERKKNSDIIVFNNKSVKTYTKSINKILDKITT